MYTILLIDNCVTCGTQVVFYAGNEVGVVHTCTGTDSLTCPEHQNAT